MSGEGRGRRLGERKLTRTRAKITDAADFATDVWLRDISSTGARLEPPRFAELPRRFTLRNAVPGRDVEVELVWRDGVDIGVRFVTAQDEEPRAKPTETPPVK